jgi:prepilin-type N-terminal cleavage/methylation domain-containing protein
MLMFSKMWVKIKNHPDGFTLLELLMVITVIGLLMAITYSVAVPRYKERTYFTRANSELNTMGNALTLYVAKYNDYPADVSRNIPAGMMEFIQAQGQNDSWPSAPWPGSVYDYDYWTDWSYHAAGEASGPIVQISVRFCNAGDTPTCKKNFPDEPWVTSSWDSNSAVYYCIHGPCRSHQSQPANHPGYCINCGGAAKFY